MSKKKVYIVVLFFLGLAVSELHQLIKFDGVKRYAYWFIDVPKYPPTFQWYLHDLFLLFRDVMWMWGLF